MFGQVKVDTESGMESGSDDSNYHPGKQLGAVEADMTKRGPKSYAADDTMQCLKAAKAKNETWTEAENKLLFEYQREYGNCWSIIAKKLNRSDNSVKNHFYSTFRKSVRHINKFIKQYCRRFKIKSISNRALLNILSASEEVRLNRDEVSPETIQRCQAIKLNLIKYSSETATFDKGDLFDLIRDILEVNKDIKLQKNIQTENIINTIGQKTGWIPNYESELHTHRLPQSMQAKPPMYLVSPGGLQEMGHIPMSSVSTSTPLAVGPQPTIFYPMLQPMNLPCPQVLCCLMTPYGVPQF